MSLVAFAFAFSSQTADLSYFTPVSSTISTCQEYFDAEKTALINNNLTTGILNTPSGCTIDGNKMCGTTDCGAAALYYGATFFENSDIGCSCCVSELSCGEYSPTNENDLSLAPLYNVTMTRNDVSAMVSLFDCTSCIIFLLMWKFMYMKVKVVIRQTDDDNVTASDYTVFVTGLPKDAKEEVRECE